ncbi:hypothetical protein U1Q18_014508, partial [Sarracenia purpurea var. burkii]
RLPPQGFSEAVARSRTSPSREAQSPSRVPNDISAEGHLDDESDQEGLNPDIEVADLLVKSATYGVDIANQSLRNALDVQAHHQAKERIVGKGNNLLGTKPVPGRGGVQRRGGFGGRGVRFNRPSYSDVVRGKPQEGEGQSSDSPRDIPHSPGPLAHRSRFGQLNLVE